MDRLSAESETVLAIARQEAAGLHHEFTGTEHILLGLLACDDDIAEPLLCKHGIVAVEVRAQVARPGGRADAGPENAQPLTARAKQVLTLASREAEALDDLDVRPEHLLLGIIRQASGVAALVLRDMGVDLAELREEVLEARAARESLVAQAGLGREGSPPGPDRGNGKDISPASDGVETWEEGRSGGKAERSREAALPMCPGCGRRLTEVLATATVSPEGPSPSDRRRRAGSVTLIYCGACGHTLAAAR